MWMNDTVRTFLKNGVVELIYAVNYINQQNWCHAAFPFKES